AVWPRSLRAAPGGGRAYADGRLSLVVEAVNPSLCRYRQTGRAPEASRPRPSMPTNGRRIRISNGENRSGRAGPSVEVAWPAMERRTPRLELVPYAPELDEAIVEFNRRLDAGRAEGGFRLTTGPGPPPIASGAAVGSQEHYVTLEGEVVRGGVSLQVQPFRVDGETQTVANLQLPLSEGIVDRRYAFVGGWLIKHVLHRYPRCFALGMGGEDRQLPQLLRAMGFAIWTVPFFFVVANVSRAARELPAIGPGWARRAGSALLRFSGAGTLASKAWLARAAWASRDAREIGTDPVREWEAWADEIWAEARPAFRVAAVRDSRTLPALFPVTDRKFPALRLHRGG